MAIFGFVILVLLAAYVTFCILAAGFASSFICGKLTKLEILAGITIIFTIWYFIQLVCPFSLVLK